MRERLGRARAQLPYIPDTWRLIWASSRPWTIAWSVLLIVQGLLPIALVYLTGALADRVGAFVQSKDWTHFMVLVPAAVLILVVLLLMQSLGSVQNWVRTIQGEKVQDHIFDLIHAKALELDLSFYDSPDYYNRLFRASVDAYDRPTALLQNMGVLIQNTLTFVAMAFILIRFAWWLPIVLLVGMAPVLLVVTRYTIREYTWRQQSTEMRRRANYYDWLITDRHSAMELRLLGVGNLFRRGYRQTRSRLRAEHAALARSQAMGELAAGALALLSAGLVMLWMLGRLMVGQATLGEAAILYQAFSQGQGLVQSLLGSVGQVLRNILFVEHLFDFLKMKPRLAAGLTSKPRTVPMGSAICFDNVSFRYPESEHWALRNFDLRVPTGQVAAIVGENGAGKSTVARLLCRFYDPQLGKVSIDDIDLREMRPRDIWRNMTVLFQEPVHYDDSARMNIALGDCSSEQPAGKIIAAAEAASAHDLIMALPAQYETVLGKWFGGAELSTGEWQRLALARAFLRRSPIIVLDEPTSAMDSWAEVDWMSKWRRLAAHKTAILITHRFTTAMQADIIHVMFAGHIVESGSHAELLRRKGKYAHSWRQQMRVANMERA